MSNLKDSRKTKKKRIHNSVEQQWKFTADQNARVLEVGRKKKRRNFFSFTSTPIYSQRLLLIKLFCFFW